MTVLEVADLTVRLPPASGGGPLVDRVSFSLSRGEALGLVGESGSGKSMTALAVIGLLPPGLLPSGSIRLDGEELLGRSDREMSAVRGRRIGMIFQEPMTSLDPVMTVGAQVAEGFRLHFRLSRAEADARARTMLERVGLPPTRISPDRYPHQLSGGQRQRVMIAMALAPGPDLVIADEPTTALDVTIQAEILDLLAELTGEAGAALMMISHDLGVIAETTDRMLVMYRGAAVEAGPTASVFRRMAHPYTRGLFAAMPSRVLAEARPERLAIIPGQTPGPSGPRPPCLFSPRCPLAAPICGEPPPWVAIEPGHAALCWRTDVSDKAFTGPKSAEPAIAPRSSESGPSSPAGEDGKTPTEEPSPPILSVQSLARAYPLPRRSLFGTRQRFLALDHVSFAVPRGGSVGLVGESGSGKSTLARLVLALDAPTSGRILFDGTDLASASATELRRLRRRLQIVFQDPYGSLDPRHRVRRIVAEPLGLLPELSPAERRERAAAALAAVGLDAGALDRFPHEFSGGQRQRIAIARALVTEPDLLVADEPVSALDVSIQAQILNLFADLRRTRRLAYLFVSHDLSVVRLVTDRVVVLFGGRIVEEGPTDAVLTRPAHPYTRALVESVPLPDPARRRRGRAPAREGERRAGTGCAYAARCDRADDVCRSAAPPLVPVGVGRKAACFRPIVDE